MLQVNFFSFQTDLPTADFFQYLPNALILSQPVPPRLLPSLTPNRSCRETEKAQELTLCSTSGSNVSVYLVTGTGGILSCMDHWSEAVWPFLHSLLAEMSSACLNLTYFNNRLIGKLQRFFCFETPQSKGSFNIMD